MLFKQDSADINAVAEHLALSDGEIREVLTSTRKGHMILKAGSESAVVYITAFPKEFDLYNTDPNRVKGEVTYG